MKKNRLFSKSVFLLLAMAGMSMGFTACSSSNDDDPTPTVRQGEESETPNPAEPTPADMYKAFGYVEGAITKVEGDANRHEDVYQFFKKELPPTSMTYQENPFELDDESDRCYFVNSYDELQAIYRGSEPLPDIDFGSYTLIVGQKRSSGVIEAPDHQAFYVKDGQNCLDLYYIQGLVHNAIVYVHYWGLYPKIEREDVSVNVIISLVD